MCTGLCVCADLLLRPGPSTVGLDLRLGADALEYRGVSDLEQSGDRTSAVIADDRAKCVDDNYRPNVEAGPCRSIDGSKDKYCLAGQRQSQAFQSHDQSYNPIPKQTHELLQFSEESWAC